MEKRKSPGKFIQHQEMFDQYSVLNLASGFPIQKSLLISNFYVRTGKDFQFMNELFVGVELYIPLTSLY
jgi:hypothetical protein